MPSQRPLTSASSESGSAMSSRSSVVDPSTSQKTPSEQDVHTTPLKRKREKQELGQDHVVDKSITIRDQGASAKQLYFIDDQSMDRAYSLLAQNEWINDDCVNSLLEIFNPDPSVWHVFSTLTNTQIEQSDSSSSKKDAANLPKKLMIPLHLSSVSHWVLAAYDMARRRCIVYDPMANRKYIEHTLKVVHVLLKKHGLWQGERTTEVDHFPPSMRQTDGNNCGVFVIAAALSLFNDTPIQSFTPDLWRDLLAAYFCTKDEPPRESISPRFTDIVKSAELDQDDGSSTDKATRDVKFITEASSRASAYAEEARLLMKITDTRLERLKMQEEGRERLLKLVAWYAQKPDCVNDLTNGIIAASRERDGRQLRAMPRLVKGGVRQLTALRNHCSSMVDKCTVVETKLKQKRDQALKKALGAYLDLGSKLADLESARDVGNTGACHGSGIAAAQAP